jgi:hypothetical protein
MPPKLTEYELETCARALRAFAHQEAAHAKAITTVHLQEAVTKRAQAAAVLAERFERARARDRDK